MDKTAFMAKKIGSECRRAFAIALYSVRKRMTSPRVICIFVMLGVYIWSNMTFVPEITKMLGLRINPIIFPFFSSSPIPQLVLYSGIVFLYSDAPFIDETQPYIIIRSKRTTWAWGQILHIIMFSGLCFLILIGFSMLVALPDATLATNGWGKVINTLAQTNAGSATSLSFYISDKIPTAYSPLQALVYCFLLNWGMTSFLGILMFAANLRFGKMVGPVLGGIILLYDLLVLNTFAIKYYKTSPLSMSRLSMIDPNGLTEYPSTSYAFAFYAIGIVICSAFIVLSVKKQTIENSLVL
jgi:hypothetical protein